MDTGRKEEKNRDSQSGRSLRQHGTALALTALLIQACATGNVATVVSLITERHAHPSGKGKLGRTPLHVACLHGHIEIVKYLINEQGVTPSCEDDNGNTPLHCANSSAIARFLVEEKKCDINHRNKYNDTPLHDAAYNGQLDVVEYLITSQHCDPACKGRAGYTPLHSACCGGHIEVVKYLINKQGVNPSCEDNNGTTPLHCTKTREVAQYLVETMKCDINHRNMYNDTPLHVAANKGRLDIVKYLITSQHCDPACKGKHTPLHSACFGGRIEVVKYLIDKHGVDPSCEDDNGTTPLHFAKTKKVAQYLVENMKCDINHRNKFNDTSLHIAALNGRLDVVEYFTTSQHCDPACKGPNGGTPVHAACSGGHIEVVKYLSNKQGVNPSCKDDDGTRPIHCAKTKEIVRFLVEDKGCDITHKNNFDETALDRAVKKNRLDVIEYLEHHRSSKWTMSKCRPIK